MNATQRVKKTPTGIDLVRRIASEGDRIFSMKRARELAPEVGIRDAYLAEALHHLHRNGWIVPLRRGLYAISTTVPGITPVHEFEIAMALVDPAAISHWSALHYHGLTDQIPQTTFVLTTTESSIPRIRGSKSGKTVSGGYPIIDMTYRFVQVKPERYFGTEKAWIGETSVTITDPERTLLDGLCMPQYCGDFAEVIHAFDARMRNLNVKRIIEYACMLDTATAKRLGWVLELHGIKPAHLSPLLKLPIKGYRKLDPTGPRKGPCNSRWMIQENFPGIALS